MQNAECRIEKTSFNAFFILHSAFSILNSMTPTLLKTSLRHLLKHPWQVGLAILGVALGVAVVVSIDLANGSATRAFALSTETVAGRATHEIVGGPSGLDETIYRKLRVELGVRAAAPLVEGYAA